MLEIEELILKETPFLSIKDITQEEWVALDYELEVYDRAGKDYDLRKLPMLPFILREIHNNETTFFNIPGFIRDGFQFRKLVAIYNPRLKRILRKREDVEMNRVETTKFLGELLKSSRLSGMGKYWATSIKDVAYLPVQYQYYEEKKSLMEKVKSCIQQSISGIKYSERTLENKFVHKLLKKALGVPESM